MIVDLELSRHNVALQVGGMHDEGGSKRTRRGTRFRDVLGMPGGGCGKKSENNESQKLERSLGRISRQRI